MFQFDVFLSALYQTMHRKQVDKVDSDASLLFQQAKKASGLANFLIPRCKSTPRASGLAKSPNSDANLPNYLPLKASGLARSPNSDACLPLAKYPIVDRASHLGIGRGEYGKLKALASA